MDKMKDRRILLSIPAKTLLNDYIVSQKAKNPGVPGYMTSRNSVVSDIVIKFIENSVKGEVITPDTNRSSGSI